ncbi:MAG TPA: hypothetical protein VHG30_13730 [Microvirga sp.]|nr:hypothetical protein [Microvirga sp.]
MLRAFVPPETLIHTPPDPFYPADLLPELQSMLKALADVEVRYERERERLARSSEPDEVRERLLAALERQRRREREPYVRRLSELHARMVAAVDLGSPGGVPIAHADGSVWAARTSGSTMQ